MQTVRRSLLDQELLALRAKIAHMGSLVDNAIRQGVTAACERNAVLASEVIEGDAAVNELRFTIEKEVLQTIARHQPVASDLRTLLTITHIAIELERIADHAADIAYLGQHLAEEPPVENLHKVPVMAEDVRQMVRDGVQAYAERDEERARAILQTDDRIDRRYRRLIRETLREMQEADNVRRANYLLWIGHELERIGDRATNIAERVLFMIGGEYVEEVSQFAWLD